MLEKTKPATIRAAKALSRDTSPAAAPPIPVDEVLTSAAAAISDAMDQLLIFAAALKASDCELARPIGGRLGIGALHNDLDLVREMLLEHAASGGQ